MFHKIAENAPEDFGKYSRRFRGMLKGSPWNVIKDSREYSRTYGESFPRFT